jgi:hypothetical protein
VNADEPVLGLVGSGTRNALVTVYGFNMTGLSASRRSGPPTIPLVVGPDGASGMQAALPAPNVVFVLPRFSRSDSPRISMHSHYRAGVGLRAFYIQGGFTFLKIFFGGLDRFSTRPSIKTAGPSPKTSRSAPVNIPLPYTVRGSVGTPTFDHVGEFTWALGAAATPWSDVRAPDDPRCASSRQPGTQS